MEGRSRPDAPVEPPRAPESSPLGEARPAKATRGLPFPEFAKQGQAPEAAPPEAAKGRKSAKAPEAAEAPKAAEAPDLDAMATDAYFASFGTAVTRVLTKRREEFGRLVQESVIGSDDRVRVQDVDALPFRWVCQLIITAGNSTTWMGTGWLASPRVVITAGHCVFMHNQGGWVQRVVVCPERNGQQRPYTLVSTQPRSVQGWVVGKAAEQDYGALILEPGGLPPDFGYMGYGTFDDADLLGLQANLTGYPSDKDAGTLWGHTRNLVDVRPRTLAYDIDTYGGMSGAPVIRWDGTDYIVVGIHNYGDVSGNQATRITPEVFQNVNFWKSTAP